MIVKEKTGNIKDIDMGGRMHDYLELEWYETSKKILHKRTASGTEIVLKLLNEKQGLTEGDLLYFDEQTAVIVSIKPCDSIVIKPSTMYEMAFVCYEIGNKHLPLFYNDGELMIPYEAPIFKTLESSGLSPQVESRKLLKQLKTTVSAHTHTETKSLFSRILQITSPDA